LIHRRLQRIRGAEAHEQPLRPSRFRIDARWRVMALIEGAAMLRRWCRRGCAGN
jgi:hypothetical protein